MAKMVRSNENFTGLTRPSSIQGELRPPIRGKINGGGMGGGNGGQQRRALSNINRNIVGAPAPYPCVVHKRGGALTQKNPIANKNPPIPVHRPITRKFAAQIANKQQQPYSLIQETKKIQQSFPNGGSVLVEEEDSIISDVEDFKTTDGYPVPMSVQHTEALLEEIDRMVIQQGDAEVEMEDIIDEPIADIDSNDKKNPLAVVEYIDDIYSYYRKSEISGCVQPNYMAQQFDINERMRAILIDWLIEVHYKFELMEETLYLTVNLIDRFLALQTVVRKKLQLVGVTAMLIACKYEEVSVPVVEDLILISDRAYTRQEVLDMESLMINTLQFNLSVPTPYVFMRRFLKAAESDRKMELLSFFIIELCLVEYEMLKFPPSLLAAAAIFTAQCSLYGSKQWSKTCEKHTKYSEQQLLECAKFMANFHQKSGTGKLTGVFRKYSTSKYGYAAKSSGPAIFLMDNDENDTRIINQQLP